MASFNSCSQSLSSFPGSSPHNTKPHGLNLTHPFHASLLSPQMDCRPVSNYSSIQPSGPPFYSFESWANDLEMGVEAEGGILERDGPACLSRSEYQITYRELESTSYSSQTQKENMSPLFFDSPDSTASQDGSVISAKPYTPYHGIKSSSGKRFKCEYQGCAYAASRRDHVRAHFKAHHDGNPFVCSKCKTTYVYPGDLQSHACNKEGKELRTICAHCGSSVNKKGLKRHQDTIKCKTNQIAR